MITKGKIIGLQMKRAYLTHKRNPKYPHLYWMLKHKNSDTQFRLIEKHPEIFYCLPTFTNREWYKTALQHCIFWRPQKDFNEDCVWYDKPVRTGNSITLDKDVAAHRWGAFI